MTDEVYPGFYLKSLPASVTEAQLSQIIYREFGNHPERYQGGAPRIIIYRPSHGNPALTGPKGKQRKNDKSVVPPKYANAVVAGLLVPFQEIRLRLARVEIMNFDTGRPMLLEVMDVDFLVERNAAGSFDGLHFNYLLHDHMKSAHGNVHITNWFDKQFLDSKMGRLREIGHVVVFDDCRSNVNKGMITPGGNQPFGRIVKYSRPDNKVASKLKLNNLLDDYTSIELHTVVEAFQTVTFLNRNRNFSTAQRSFITSDPKQVCSVEEMFLGTGQQPLRVEEYTLPKRPIPFDSFDSALIDSQKRLTFVADCVSCHRQYQLIGPEPDLRWTGGKCPCIEKALSKRLEMTDDCEGSTKDDKVKEDLNGLFYAWNDEPWVRLATNHYAEAGDMRHGRPGTEHEGELLVPLLRGVKAQYRSTTDFYNTAYKVAMFEYAYDNHLMWTQGQIKAKIRSVRPIDDRKNVDDNDKKCKYTHVKLNTLGKSKTWSAEGSTGIGKVLMVVEPGVKIELANQPKKKDDDKIGYFMRHGEQPVPSRLKHLEEAENHCSVDLGCSVPHEVNLAEGMIVTLIPRSPASEKTGLRAALKAWKDYRDRVENGPIRITGNTLSLDEVSEHPKRFLNGRIGTEKSYILRLEVSPLPIWQSFDQYLTEYYVGADVTLDTRVHDTMDEYSPICRQTVNGRVVGYFLDKASEPPASGTRFPIPTKHDKHVLEVVFWLECFIKPMEGECILQLWSQPGLRNVASSGPPPPEVAEEEVEGEIEDYEDEAMEEEDDDLERSDADFDRWMNGGANGRIPNQNRDIREAPGIKYIEAFENFPTALDLDTETEFAIDNVRRKPVFYPNHEMLDFLLFKTPNGLVNHCPKVNYRYPRNDEQCALLARRLLRKLKPAQKEAVEKAFWNRLSIVLGPPGTGKTFTLAAAVVYMLLRECGTIVVGCPSNYACQVAYDAIMKLLNELELNWLKFRRLFSHGRESKMIREDRPADRDDNFIHVRVHSNDEWTKDRELFRLVQKVKSGLYCMKLEDELHYESTIKKFQNGEIDAAGLIIATIGTLSDGRIHRSLGRIGRRGGFLSALFLDEVSLLGSAPTIIAQTLQPKRLAIFGDDRQLPPVPKSVTGKYANADVSWMTFLRTTDFFQTHDIYTELNVQFRMADQICKFVKLLSYNVLESDDSVLRRNYMDDVYKPLYKEFPKLKGNNIMLFSYNEYNQETVDGESRSKVNQKEVRIAEGILSKLRKAGVSPDKVGVISTYDQQTRMIKGNRSPTSKLSCSSCDAFQGKEKDFIILSMVRSNIQGKIGFLHDKRRLNVSISRAKHFLFIIYDHKLFETTKIPEIRKFFTELREECPFQICKD